MLSAHQFARIVAVDLCEQVVIPFPVGVGAQKWILAGLPDHRDMHPLAGGLIDRIKRGLIGFDPPDSLFSRHAPSVGQRVRNVADMRDVLMGAQGDKHSNYDTTPQVALLTDYNTA